MWIFSQFFSKRRVQVILIDAASSVLSYPKLSEPSKCDLIVREREQKVEFSCQPLYSEGDLYLVFCGEILLKEVAGQNCEESCLVDIGSCKNISVSQFFFSNKSLVFI